MTIGFIGIDCREKTFFLMYLAKILSQGGPVTLVTENNFLTPALDVYSYSDTLTIRTTLQPPADEGIVLVDINKAGQALPKHYYKMTETDRPSLEANEALFGAYPEGEENVGQWLLMNVIMDGNIDIKYLCSRLGIHKKTKDLQALYLNDNDLSVHIENGYNEALEIRHLSGAYKKILMMTVAAITSEPVKEQRRWLKRAERSK